MRGHFVVVDILDPMATYGYGYHVGEPTADAEFHVDPAVFWAGLSEEERSMRVEIAEAMVTVSLVLFAVDAPLCVHV